MSLIRLNTQPSRRHLIQFGVAWVVFFLLLAILTARKSSTEVLWILGLLAILPPLIGCLFPSFLRLLYVALAVLTYPIGLVVSYFVLSGLYYLVLTPTGLILRLAKLGFFPAKPDPSLPSYWHSRSNTRKATDYFKPY